MSLDKSAKALNELREKVSCNEISECEILAGTMSKLIKQNGIKEGNFKIIKTEYDPKTGNMLFNVLLENQQIISSEKR